MKFNKIGFINLIFSVCAGLILSLSWTGLPLGWTMFFAFIPILLILDNFLNSDKKQKKLKFFGNCYIAFFIWNIITTWWVSNASLEGAVAAVVCYSLFMSLTMLLVYIVLKKLGKKFGYFALITFWLSYEYIFMNSDVAFPWLILGNAFANNIKLVQWYEFIGHLGGSVWVLIINILLFELIQKFRKLKLELNNKKYIRNICFLGLFVCLVILIPITYSLIRYYNYEDSGKEINVVVIQPNIDPYNEKFDGLSVEEQLNIIIEEAEKMADSTVDYFIAPETAIPNYMIEDEIAENKQVIYLKSFVEKYPNSKLLIGASTRRFYPDGVGKTETARKLKLGDDYYDIYNTSMQIDTSAEIPLYHKSMLVPGVEIMPFPQVFGFLQDIIFDLGGMTGSHGKQPDREVFVDKTNGIKVAVPICYESVFGEFVAEFTKNGANFIAIITNDGWWGDTWGYKQHESFAKLRAVETRKSIARSANTGISCFINQRGDVQQTLEWDRRGALKQKIKVNDKITFFANYGDFIARSAMFISALIILMVIYSIISKDIFRKKSKKLIKINK